MLVRSIQFLPNVYLIVLILPQCNENKILYLDVERIEQSSFKQTKERNDLSNKIKTHRIILFTYIFYSITFHVLTYCAKILFANMDFKTNTYSTGIRTSHNMYFFKKVVIIMELLFKKIFKGQNNQLSSFVASRFIANSICMTLS